MSHEIELIDGKYQFAFAGESTWHGLGTHVAGNLTPEEIMIAAGVDWEVEVVPYQREINGEMVESKFSAELRRVSDGRELHNVTPNWEPVQNRDAFAFFDEWVKAGDMTMETAGSLRDGQIVFALARIGETFEITAGDKVKPYMLFTNYHRYGKATNARLVMERVVCKNTHSVAMRENAQHSFSMTHAKAFDAEKAKESMGFAVRAMDQYQADLRTLTEAKYTLDEAKEFAAQVFPITGKNLKKKELSRNAEELIGILDSQPGADAAPGTFFNLYNAVTFMTSHTLGNNEENRLDSTFFGANAKRSAEALQLALAMAA